MNIVPDLAQANHFPVIVLTGICPWSHKDLLEETFTYQIVVVFQLICYNSFKFEIKQ